MRTQHINSLSSVMLVLFSLTALATVVTGLIWPPPMPEPDEGTQAHIFQLSIAALFPLTAAVLATRLTFKCARYETYTSAITGITASDACQPKAPAVEIISAAARLPTR